MGKGGAPDFGIKSLFFLNLCKPYLTTNQGGRGERENSSVVLFFPKYVEMCRKNEIRSGKRERDLLKKSYFRVLIPFPK